MLAATTPVAAAEKTTKSSKSSKTTKPAPAPAPATQAQKPAAPQINAIAQAMAQQGVARCVPRANQFTSFLTANSQAGATLFIDPSGPDRNLASVSMEVRAQNNILSYASATFMPVQGTSECSGMYESVTYWNNKCDEVGSKAFGSFQRARPLRQSIATLTGGPTVRVYLMPAGQGCLSVKREIVY